MLLSQEQACDWCEELAVEVAAAVAEAEEGSHYRRAAVHRLLD